MLNWERKVKRKNASQPEVPRVGHQQAAPLAAMPVLHILAGNMLVMHVLAGNMPDLHVLAGNM